MNELFLETADKIYTAIQFYFHPHNIREDIKNSIIKLLVTALSNAFLMGKSYQAKEDTKQLKKSIKQGK